jgi:hypothetical protein
VDSNENDLNNENDLLQNSNDRKKKKNDMGLSSWTKEENGIYDNETENIRIESFGIRVHRNIYKDVQDGQCLKQMNWRCFQEIEGIGDSRKFQKERFTNFF